MGANEGTERRGAALAARVRDGAHRLLVVAASHGGAEALVAGAADELALEGVDARVLSSNPGSPLFGPPGALALARRERGRWKVERVEALCTLDAVRFRLPLVLAARRLVDREALSVLLAVAPSVTRGIAASELREALTEALALDGIFGAGEDDGDGETRALTAADRRRRRTELWDRHLSSAREATVSLASLDVEGAAPPLDLPAAWPGRQVALVGGDGRTLALGEARELAATELRLSAPPFDAGAVRGLRVRDARRVDGALVTEHRPPSSTASSVAADLDARPQGEATLVPPVVSLASAKVLLVNGVFGDPLLHVRLRHRKRSLLFDLGEAGRLQGRIAHQVSDVFVTHAHFDHFGGFSWLLRACIGSPHPRRLWGPPGLAGHVEGVIGGILWDRIGERGPRFEVGEVHGEEIRRFAVRVGGNGATALPSRRREAGLLLDEPGLRVRAAVLDHGVPVLAFSFEEPRALHVRREALEASGLAPGPWLSRLKELALAGAREALVELPDGSHRAVADLEEALLLSRPGQKLAYATDLDDSEPNREAVVELARGAYVLYLEASFAEEDRALARASQHLTARACGEIAAAAEVDRLVPFHFSKRYDGDPSRVYAQVAEVFPGLVVAGASGGPG